MSGASRTLGLMALREKARIAVTLADLRTVAQQKAEAERMVERLNEALSRQGKPGGVRLATEIAAERHMAAQILSEVERHRARQEALETRLTEEQARLSQQEHRHQTLMEKAGSARKTEAEEKLALREAAMPPRRR
ncbi:hypothetical protein G5V65_04030 [Rhodobacter sp. HX-7-19]|uniref:Flagellar FliJ protein n=1 Tax=Paragemmobacter kunshanensis TaxID=2583234 RepID=A0A6M1TVJ2_9RHOB|nr:hypothetical protein [Rhodobacter kunshanensis]NGQ90052.1 hypothetical protein [Rhodobacter kunshanensis]